MIKRSFFYLVMVIMMFSCGKDETIVRYVIASQTADCTGVAPQKCLLVKMGDTPDWEFFYNNIEGFDYEEGYEYVLDVKEEKVENVPADASSLKYTLVKEISKTAKESENLPESVIAQRNKEIQWGGRVLSIEQENIGQGAATGRFPATVVQVEVSHTTSDLFKAGDIIHCELVPSPTVMPEVGREYIFKAKNAHPAHAKGIYLLETNVQDLVV